MSDQKLRDLERRWKETGTVEDEAAYLLERVRAGDLSQERLELAAYCGHEGARTARLWPRQEFENRDAVRTWARGLKQWRGASLDGLLLLADIFSSLKTWEDPLLAQAVESAAAWKSSPNESNAEACNIAAQRLVHSRHLRANQVDGPVERYVAWACAWVAGTREPVGGVTSHAFARCLEEFGIEQLVRMRRDLAASALLRL